MTRSSVIWLTGLLLAVGLVVMLAVPAVRESQTQDEAVYVTSGLSYWRTGDFRLNLEHPPLLKLLYGLPLVLRHATFQPEAGDWNGADQWTIGVKVLYRNVISGQDLLISARFVNILLTLGLVALLAAWAGQTWGRGAALVVGILAAFEPNILANGHLATTDVGYTLAVLGSIFAFGWLLARPTWRRTILSAIIFSIAILTRYNALLLVALLPIQVLVVTGLRRGRWPMTRGQGLRVIGIFAIIAIVMTWAAYGFEVRRLNLYQDSPAREALAGYPGALSFLEKIPLPAMSYLSGLLFQYQHNAGGQPGYLFGKTSDYGWWYYGLAAMLVKMTLGTLVLGIVGALTVFRKRDADPVRPVFTVWFLLVPFVIFTASSFFSQLPIGVRYLLPSIALLLVLAGGGAVFIRRFRFGRYLIAGLFLWHVISVVRMFPHWLPYANEVAGGPAKLEHQLIDANLDWGQDIPLVAAYMKKNQITDYRTRFFSTVPVAAFGVSARPVPTDHEVANTPFHGVIAIGKSVLYYPHEQYQWLREIQPTAVLGYSTNIYILP